MPTLTCLLSVLQGVPERRHVAPGDGSVRPADLRPLPLLRRHGRVQSRPVPQADLCPAPGGPRTVLPHLPKHKRSVPTYCRLLTACPLCPNTEGQCCPLCQSTSLVLPSTVFELVQSAKMIRQCVHDATVLCTSRFFYLDLKIRRERELKMRKGAKHSCKSI